MDHVVAVTGSPSSTSLPISGASLEKGVQGLDPRYILLDHYVTREEFRNVGGAGV